MSLGSSDSDFEARAKLRRLTVVESLDAVVVRHQDTSGFQLS